MLAAITGRFTTIQRKITEDVLRYAVSTYFVGLTNQPLLTSGKLFHGLRIVVLA